MDPYGNFSLTSYELPISFLNYVLFPGKGFSGTYRVHSPWSYVCISQVTERVVMSFSYHESIIQA